MGAFVVGGRLWVGGGQRRKRLGVYGNAMREVKEVLDGRIQGEGLGQW